MKKFLLLSAIVFASLTQAQVNYNFETAQGYTVGPIAMQNGWGTTTGSPVVGVSAEQSNPGAQSLKLTGTNGTVHTAAGAISPTVSVAGPVVTVLFNAYFTTSPVVEGESDFFFSAQSPSEQTINARMRFTYEGDILIIGTDFATQALGYLDTGATFSRNVWNAYKMVIDFAGGTTEYYQNGTLIYTSDVVGGTMVGNFAVTSDNYNSNAYFDGIRAVSGILGTSEMENAAKTFSIYPNPTSDVLNITSDDKLKAVNVFDMSGRKVDAKLTGKVVDVRALQTGTYLISVETAKGTSTEKFIKK